MMGIMEFQEKFGTEEQCRLHLFRARWPKGFVCPKCGGGERFDIRSRHLFQCKACGRQTSVTAGTVLDKTRTPLTKWFMAIYLMAADKRGVSALALARHIGVAYYTAWTMCHKIRHAMGARDGGRALGGTVEMDEAFFGAPEEGGKRGRGAEKTPVLVSVSLTGGGKPKAARMKVVGAVGRGEVKEFAEGAVRKGSEVRTDGLHVYRQLAGLGFRHVWKRHDPKKEPAHLRWMHVIISNAKSMVGGTFHGLGARHLQRYLDEFCCRFNRRWDLRGVFSRLLDACAYAGRITYAELIG